MDARPLHERALKLSEKLFGLENPSTTNQLNNLALDLFNLGLDDIKTFYTRSLTGLGFVVRDDGFGILTPEGAEFFGLAGTLIAERPDTSDEDYKYVAVQIRTEDGWLVRSRLLTVQWRKTVPDMTPR